MSYYEPTLLFRNNAIRRSPYSSPHSTESQLNLPSYSSNTSNWLLNPGNDTSILNKICSLDRLNIKSNYWRIPDYEMNLTSMAIKANNDVESRNHATMAISSGGKSNNLFIYELDVAKNYLTHHNTISLPNIHSMKWVPKTENILMAGNNKGYGHLITTPGIESNESAEILKRFNHRKHLKSINKDPSIFNHSNTIIEKMNFINQNELVTIYDNNLFNWDLHDATSCSKPKPKHITSINGLMNFDVNHYDRNLLGVVGKFGISLFDLRDPKFSIPEVVKSTKNKNQLHANLIKWNPDNEFVFASGHMDGVIRLWDIRKQSNFGKLTGHNGKVINTIDWIDGDLFSGGKDGNIIHWDLTTDLNSDEDLLNCGLKEGIKSINFDASTNSESIIDQRQCGTVLPASNSNIIHLETLETFDDLKVLSIDGSSYFGLHSKIYDAVNFPASKNFYSKEDLNLIMAEHSNVTLVEDDIESIHTVETTETVDSLNTNDFEFTKPLAISRNPTQLTTPKQSITNTMYSTNTTATITYSQPNGSNDTLLDDSLDSSNDKFDFTPNTTISPTNFDSDMDKIDLSENIDFQDLKYDEIIKRAKSTYRHSYHLSEVKFDDFQFAF